MCHSLLSQGGAQVFKLLVSIGIGGWTVRYLGPQNLGTLSYVTALVELLGPLGNLGVKGSLSAMLCEEQPMPGLLGYRVDWHVGDCGGTDPIRLGGERPCAGGIDRTGCFGQPFWLV